MTNTFVLYFIRIFTKIFIIINLFFFRLVGILLDRWYSNILEI
jgi:hypothetical protein